MRTPLVDSPHKQNILILGAGGMLGHMLVRILSPSHLVFGTTSRPRDERSPLGRVLSREQWVDGVDVREWQTVEKTISHTGAQVVVNCVGVIKQKMESSSVLDAILVNSLVPHKLALTCEKAGIRLIHLSTDCVFEGSPGLRLVSDTPNATDLYGTTKRLGEITYGPSLTLRTAFVGRQLTGSEGLFEWVRSQHGKTVNGYKEAIYSGLTTMALSRVIQQIIENHSHLSGLHQVASTPISKFDLITRLNHLLSLGLTVLPDTSFICDRSMDGTQFTELTKIEIPSWDAMLSDFAHDQSFYDVN